MSSIDFIYTDVPLKKTCYTIKDMFGTERTTWTPSGGTHVGVRFSNEKLPSEAEEAAGHIFPGMARYEVLTGIARFNYLTIVSDGLKETDSVFLDWLFMMIKDHLRNGAEKFYYASLWYGRDPDADPPRMKEVDLTDFEPRENRRFFRTYRHPTKGGDLTDRDPDEEGFHFSKYSICEFVDSSVIR
jgi:hypothetical protein